MYLMNREVICRVKLLVTMFIFKVNLLFYSLFITLWLYVKVGSQFHLKSLSLVAINLYTLYITLNIYPNNPAIFAIALSPRFWSLYIAEFRRFFCRINNKFWPNFHFFFLTLVNDTTVPSPVACSSKTEALRFAGSVVGIDLPIWWLLLLWSKARPPRRKWALGTKIMASINCM